MEIRTLLSALIRLFAVYEVIIGLKSICVVLAVLIPSAVIASRDLSDQWHICIMIGSGGVLSLAVGILLFLKANLFSKVIMPTSDSAIETSGMEAPLYAVVFFCFGVFLAAWGGSQIIQAISGSLATYFHNGSDNIFTLPTWVGMLPGAVLLTLGIVFCARFSSISRWIKSKV